ncbi:MAG: acyl-CoA/acyl-ACP dehydrogenase [Ralstonia sp.]|nr:MAG: acyl-CoA/acyl-ACP dehydrogenase [Ralstonia sp.]
MGYVFRTEEQQMAIDGLRRYLDTEVEPALKKHGEKFIPREMMAGFMRELVKYGLITAPISEENGGMGLDWLTHLMLFEELVYTSLDVCSPILINTVFSSVMERLAPEHLKQRYLPGLLKGELFASFGISEPDVGSNVMEVKTRARRDGDHYVINGEKTWITSGEYSDVFICTCRTSDDPKNGLTHILLDRKEHPYEVRGIDKIALNGQSTTQIFLDNVRVPVTNVIGKEGEALRNTLALFERARMHVGTQSLGIARRALDEAIRYSQERRQHGKVIAGHQLIAAKIADMATQVDAARLLIHRAASMVDSGVRSDMECSMAKLYATEMAVGVCRQAVQIHGGNGVTKEFPVERLAREAILMPIPDGTSEIQHLIIARALTGVSAF